MEISDQQEANLMYIHACISYARWVITNHLITKLHLSRVILRTPVMVINRMLNSM